MMKILAKQKFDGREEYYNQLAKPSQVKRLGKYLKDNLTGVFKVTEPPNEYIIYTTILYQIDPEVRKALKKYQKEFQGKEEDIYEMNIYLNLTTYKQFIRINVIELDENEQTLGYMRLSQEDLMSLPYCKTKIMEYVKKVIEKKYEDYEVLI
jgi:hypothetical protein